MKASWFSLACFLLLVLLVIGFSIRAAAAQTNGPAAKVPVEAVKRFVEIAGNKVHAQTEKGAKKETRTFPCMFDICGRSARARADRKGKQ